MSDSYQIPAPPDSVLLRLQSDDTIRWVQAQAYPYRRLMAYYSCAIMEVQTKFNVLNEALSLSHDRNPITSIQSRLKQPASILSKLSLRGLPATVEAIEEHLNDVAGVRVVCAFPEDVYRLADAFLRQDDVTLIQKKDYIAEPKPNGYRSLHLIVAVPIFLTEEKRLMKVEIQLRTIAMDFWASLEHQIKYKKGLDNIGELTEALRQCAEDSARLDERMDVIRKRLEASAKGECQA